jgi:hypothetical protein
MHSGDFFGHLDAQRLAKIVDHLADKRRRSHLSNDIAERNGGGMVIYVDYKLIL